MTTRCAECGAHVFNGHHCENGHLQIRVTAESATPAIIVQSDGVKAATTNLKNALFYLNRDPLADDECFEALRTEIRRCIPALEETK